LKTIELAALKDRAVALTSLVILSAVTLITVPCASARGVEQPRLVLQITVDALRGDLIDRYDHVLGKGGFRFLTEQGIHYTNAHYQHANTETIVGHASLATGAIPAAHGMI